MSFFAALLAIFWGRLSRNMKVFDAEIAVRENSISWHLSFLYIHLSCVYRCVFTVRGNQTFQLEVLFFFLMKWRKGSHGVREKQAYRKVVRIPRFPFQMFLKSTGKLFNDLSFSSFHVINQEIWRSLAIILNHN